MSQSSAVLAGRAAAERNMLDTCTVQAVTGSSVDPNTGAEVPTYALVYTGRVKVQSGATQESTPEAGGATLTVQRSEAHFPVGAFVPAVGQVVTVTAAALDPLMAGLTFRVVALLHKSAATAYRLAVTEVV